MTYHSVLAVFDAGSPPDAIVLSATAIAKRFDARVLGVVGARPHAPLYFAEGYAGEELIKTLKREAESRIMQLKTAVDKPLYNEGVPHQWCPQEPANPDYVLTMCQAADIVVTCRGDFQRSGSNPSTGNLIMQAGRPVLLVSVDAKVAGLDRIVIAWKDTRESRRAIADALPLLKKAEHVQVLFVEEDEPGEGHSHDWNVFEWLSMHGVIASSNVRPSYGNTGETIASFAKDHKADLIVAGAYGRSRFMEWAFGGVTQHLVHRTDIPVLLSH